LSFAYEETRLKKEGRVEGGLVANFEIGVTVQKEERVSFEKIEKKNTSVTVTQIAPMESTSNM